MRKKLISCDNRMLFEFCLKVTAVKSEKELVSLKQNGMLVDGLLNINAGWLKDLTWNYFGQQKFGHADRASWFILSYRNEKRPCPNYARA